jgi:hypothetical protein
MQTDSPGFTLMLTKGTHLVSDDDAARIFEAIRSGEKLVELNLDLFGDTTFHRQTTVAVAHIVCLCKNITRHKDLDDPKVTTLARRRHA